MLVTLNIGGEIGFCLPKMWKGIEQLVGHNKIKFNITEFRG
jgi:hypothetical protein